MLPVVRRTSSLAPWAALAALVLLLVCFLHPESHASDAAPASGDGILALADLVGDPAFEDVLSRSFEIILADSQLAVYSAEDDFGRFLYRKRLWTRYDPTPATDVNEFLEEHLRRLAYALEHFCPAGDMDWDERGDVALRFGLPSHRIQAGADISQVPGARGLIPPSEEWGYADQNMTVSFIDPNLDERYQLGYDIKYTTARGRPKVQNDNRNPTAGPPDPPLIPAPIELMHAMAQQKSRQARGLQALDNVPVSYGYSSVTDPLPLFYEIVMARGENGRTDMAINFQIPTAALTFEPDGERVAAGLAKRLRVMNEDYDVLTSQARVLTVLASPEIEVAEDDLLTDEWRFNVEPGVYVVGFAIEDTLSKRTAFGRSLVKVPEYPEAGLSMSDIQLARGVGPGSRFVRMGGAVVPHPIHAFQQDEEMVIYFELYGLTEDVPNIGRFTVKTEITSGQYRPDEGWFSRFLSRLVPEKPLSISTRVIGAGPVPDTAYWFSIALSTLEQDNYDLKITVKDVRSGQIVTKMAAFTVLEE
ncbi:MAG: GWxTD domain-containing protein [Candidatus Eisenbacteria sp.]|nr:GWxTD domain-containing protein [Candidatus Eisenbacteria bacterium]